MAGPLRHLGDLARARVTRRSAAREDGQALGELEARPLQLPPGLEVEWLGVSGYRISFEGQALFVDPHLSRVPFGDLVRRRPTLPDPAALDRFVHAPGKVAGVLAPRLADAGRLPLRPGLGHLDRGRGHPLLHQGSANLIDEAIREREVDVFLARLAALPRADL